MPRVAKAPRELARFGGSTSGESRASIQAAASVTAKPDSPEGRLWVETSPFQGESGKARNR